METFTKMTEFKRALYEFQTETPFTEKQCQNWTLIWSIDADIKKLLNDETMMKAKNKYNFEQRTQMTKISLLVSLFDLATNEEETAEFKEQLQHLRSILNTGIGHLDTIREAYVDNSRRK